MPPLDPKEEEQSRDRNEIAQREVRVRPREPADQAGGQEHEQQNRSEDVLPDSRSEQAGQSTRRIPRRRTSTGDEASRRPQSPWRETLRHALPTTLEETTTRTREEGEEIRLEPPEEVDRLRLRDPDPPAVPFSEHAREPSGPEERLEIGDDSRHHERDKDRDPRETPAGSRKAGWEPPRRRPMETSRRDPSEAQCAGHKVTGSPRTNSTETTAIKAASPSR